MAFASHLAERRVSERMAQTCEQRLAAVGFSTAIERVADMTALHAGASLAVWAESSTGCLFGADHVGALRRNSEAMGRFVVDTFLADVRTGATVDCHMRDQLVIFAALAQGISHYRIPYLTDHVESNLWLIEQFGVQKDCRGQEVIIRGLRLRQDQS